jgi:hypothetical protein
MATINSMPEAQAAYDQCMATLTSAHDQMNAIAAATPVDWTAYQAAVAACNATQTAAQAALAVFEAAILDVPAVGDLRQKLAEDTADMGARTKALDGSTASLTPLTASATKLTGVATTISHYV